MEFLLAQVTKHGKARWLDLCCGTGNALAQASNIVNAENHSIKIVGVDLVGMFVAHESKSLTLIEASLSTWQPTEMFDLITCIHGSVRSTLQPAKALSFSVTAYLLGSTMDARLNARC